MQDGRTINIDIKETDAILHIGLLLHEPVDSERLVLASNCIGGLIGVGIGRLEIVLSY